MPLTYLTYCKVCRIQNPQHPGFCGPPLDSLTPEQQDKFSSKLNDHVKDKHPEILAQNLAQATVLLRFLNLCVFEFQDKSAFDARDNMRYHLAKITRAYKLSDAKIEEKVKDLCLPLDACGDYTSEDNDAVIALIKSVRDQLEEIGAYSQEPEEPAVQTIESGALQQE